MQKVLFLDRDGVINIDIGYAHKKDQITYLDGFFETLKYFKLNNYVVFVVSNQSGIGRGYYSEEDVKSLHSFMNKEIFLISGFEIDGWFYCPHHPNDQCNCRKPKTGIIEKIKSANSIDYSKSVFIGDKITDFEFAANLGIKKIFILQNNYLSKADNTTISKHPNGNLVYSHEEIIKIHELESH